MKKPATKAEERDLRQKRDERRQRRRQGARDEILSATRAVVLRDGVDAFTLDSVGRELGLTKQAIYYYFPSKEDVLLGICLEEWAAAARAVHEATSRAETGADALQALIRSYVDHYAGRLEVFVLVTQRLQGSSLIRRMTPKDLEPIRPLNDLMYGPTERKLAAEKKQGELPSSLHPRRLAFSAHVAAMGLLAMKAMVEQVGDPLKHTDEDLLEELCASFRARCRM